MARAEIGKLLSEHGRRITRRKRDAGLPGGSPASITRPRLKALRVPLVAQRSLCRRLAAERIEEEQDQRDQQHVDDERLDQDETENQRRRGCRPARSGLRAMASAAAPIALPCPRRREPAAMPSAKPAVMIDHYGDRVQVPPAAAGAPAHRAARWPRPSATSANVRTDRLLTTKPPTRNTSNISNNHVEVMHVAVSRRRA